MNIIDESVHPANGFIFHNLETKDVKRPRVDYVNNSIHAVNNGKDRTFISRGLERDKSVSACV